MRIINFVYCDNLFMKNKLSNYIYINTIKF